MIAKNMPSVVTHGGAFADGNFQGLHGRKTLEHLANSQPGYEHEGKEENHTTGQNVPAARSAQGHQESKDDDFRGKTDNAATRSGKEKSDDRQ